MGDEMSDNQPQNPTPAPDARPGLDVKRIAANIAASEKAPAADETDWKAEARKWQQHAKNNLAKAEEFDALKASQMSEVEKAQKAAQEAQTALADVTRQNLRNKVALEKGVPADLVDFLSGDTEDEIAAKAGVLLKRIGAPTNPKPDLSQGARGEASGSGTPADQFANFLRRQLP